LDVLFESLDIGQIAGKNWRNGMRQIPGIITAKFGFVTQQLGELA